MRSANQLGRLPSTARYWTRLIQRSTETVSGSPQPPSPMMSLLIERVVIRQY